MNMTDYLENKVLDFLFRGQTYTAPTTLYFALFTSPASDLEPGEEPTDSAYHRAAVNCTLANFSGTDTPSSTAASTGTSGTIYNIATIAWPDPTEDWGEITHIGVFDQLVGGNYLYWAEISNPLDIVVGETGIRFAPGTLGIILS